MIFIKIFFIFLILITSTHAEIFKCIDKNGKTIYSDTATCKQPEKLVVKQYKPNINNKEPKESAPFEGIILTKDNVNYYRNSPQAIKFKFGEGAKQSVTGQYNGFYIVNNNHITFWIDEAIIKNTRYGALTEVNLESIEFALYTNTDFGSNKPNRIHSNTHAINLNLKKGESASIKDFALKIDTTKYIPQEFSKYKLLGITRNDKKYSNPISSKKFIDINKRPYPKNILALFGSASIDGRISKNEWRGTTPYKVRIKTPKHSTIPALIYIKNDNQYLYLAFKYTRPNYVSPITSLSILFNDRDDINHQQYYNHYDGQDTIVVSPDFTGNKKTKLYDDVRSSKSPCKPPLNTTHEGHCGFEDTKYGGTNDGVAAYKSSRKGVVVYELKHPLKSKDTKNDIQVNPGNILGIRIYFGMANKSASLNRYPKGYSENSIPSQGGFLRIKLATENE